MYIIKYAIKWGFKRIRNIWDIWFFYKTARASLVVQCLRIHFATQKHRFNSWSRRIPLAIGPLSPWTVATEPTCCNY